MIQKNQLKILFVEDLPSDVELAVQKLRKEKLNFEYTVVSDRIDLLKTLKKFKPDLVISDFMMPSFNGLQALKEVKQYDSDIPFILYTSSVNEETAVECIKAGAQDYVLKEHSTRLPFAAKEALEQVCINREKRASELLLKENEEKLQSIFSVAPVGIGLVINRKLIEVNDTFCNMTGYGRSELIGKSAEILYATTEEFKKVGIEKYQQIAEKGTGSIESKFRRKDGNILNVIISSKPLDKNDMSRGVTFTVLDITERKKYEEALKDSQHLFETLAQSAPVGIFRTQPDGSTTYVNPKWLELAGLPIEETLGFGWLKAVHPDDREQLEKDWISNVGARRKSIAEYRFLKSDGTISWVMGSAIPEMSGNEVTGYIGTVTDMTVHHKAQELLRLSEKKYRSIFENVQDVYYETSLTGTILELSPSIRILTKGQYQPDDLIGRSIFDFYPGTEKRQEFLSALKGRGAVTDYEITFKNFDGSQNSLSISAKLIFDSNSNPEKIVGSIHDITDRKNITETLKLAKEKAEASDRLKTEFLNNISHEVRTPLNGILGFAEIITMENLSATEKKESLDMLFESSNRLLNTITNYMDVSLITSGSLTVNKKDFIPDQLLKKVFSNFEAVCRERRLELFLEIPGQSDTYVINSDPEICRKIISHFLDNAVKFTEKGSIHFGFRHTNEQIDFYVKDTGTGINLNSFNIIFERFVKESRGSNNISEGSGLGLSIAKGMSEAIGGNIRLESEPGAGSCFYLTLPVVRDAGLSAPETPDKGKKRAKKGYPILIAEDDDTNYYYLNALLSRETDARILHALNGREAIELFKANPDIRLILMDMKMPEVDGFEATKEIKLIDPEVHIIAITAYAMSGDEEKIIAAGCDAYLSKPINKNNLLEKIAEFIK